MFLVIFLVRQKLEKIRGWCDPYNNLQIEAKFRQQLKNSVAVSLIFNCSSPRDFVKILGITLGFV